MTLRSAAARARSLALGVASINSPLAATMARHAQIEAIRLDIQKAAACASTPYSAHRPAEMINTTGASAR